MNNENEPPARMQQQDCHGAKQAIKFAWPKVHAKHDSIVLLYTSRPCRASSRLHIEVTFVIKLQTKVSFTNKHGNSLVPSAEEERLMRFRLKMALFKGVWSDKI